MSPKYTEQSSPIIELNRLIQILIGEISSGAIA
jgi:hypothetical protein